VVRSYRRRRLWGISEEAIDVFDELVALVTSPDGGADHRRRDLLTFVLDDLVGPDDAAGHALIHAAPMRSGLPAAGEAREWIVDLLATAARQMENQWWDGFDERGDPVIHGRPFTRLRNRSGLARLVLDRRIELMLSQWTVAETCGVVQGWVQAWEAGIRIPDASELHALAGVLELNRAELAGAETGSAVYRNQLSAEAQAELDALFWGSDIKVPDLAARFGLEGRRVDKLVSPAGAGVACEDCGAEMVFTTRERRRVRFAECRTCRRARYLDRHETPPALSRRAVPAPIPPW
jgi:hypothetical protein